MVNITDPCIAYKPTSAIRLLFCIQGEVAKGSDTWNNGLRCIMIAERKIWQQNLVRGYDWKKKLAVANLFQILCV